MTDKIFVTVEPAPGLASRFAVWCLASGHNIQTVSAGGFLVPVSLYPDVPEELLYGSYVDGHSLDHTKPQPEPVEPVVAPSEPVVVAEVPTRTRKSRTSRKSETDNGGAE